QGLPSSLRWSPARKGGPAVAARTTRGCEHRRLQTSTCARGALRAETSAPNALPAALSRSHAEISRRADSVHGDQPQPGLGNRRAGTHTLRPAIRISLTL